MGSLMSQQKALEQKKRYLFLGGAGLGLFATIFWTSWLGLPLLGLGAYWGHKWFDFRAKNGMRF